MSWTCEWVKPKRLCSAENCSSVHFAKNWCKIHYWRMKKHGTLDRFKEGPRDKCKIEDCSNVASIVGYCKKHYDQERHRNKPISAKANHEHHIKYRYGILAEEYHALLDSQNYSCAICKKPENVIVNGKVIRLAVDHCHARDKVRELLCIRCNRVLGSVEDNSELLQNMIYYLNKHKACDAHNG